MRPFTGTLILTASLSCGPGYATPGYIDQGVEEHVVAVSLAYSTRASWERSPWYRIGDETHELPVFVLTDTAGNSCLVPGDVWALNPRRVACPDGWRRPRAG